MSTDAIIANIWAGVAGLISVAWLVMVGYCFQQGGGRLGIRDREDAILSSGAGIVGALLWPVFACGAILALPVLSGRGLAILAARREERRVRERAEEREALRRARDAFDRNEAEWGLLDAALREVQP